QILELDLVIGVGEAGVVGRFRFEPRLSLVRRQIIGRLVLVVDDRADDERQVGIAIDIFDDHLLADAGNDLPAPALAGPHLGDAGAAGGRAILAVPVKAQPDPAVFVDVDIAFLAPVLLSDDLGGLWPVDRRAGRDDRRAEALVAFLEFV